jgi:Tfp pilus assembly protein PilF
LLRVLDDKRPETEAAVLAGIVALIWVVHPLNTQAVTYIIQRGESMMGLFYLLTLYCFIRGVEVSKGLTTDAGGSDRFRRVFWFVLAIVASAIGMGCKEVMVTAPVMVLAYDRLFVGRSWNAAWRLRGRFHLFLMATCIIPVALVLRHLPEENASAGFGITQVTWWQYAASQPEVILHYLRLSFWPAELCIDYLWPKSTGFWQVAAPMLVVAGMVGLKVRLLWRSNALAFAGLWFFGVLSVTSSVVPIVDLAMEHRMYLPLAAVIALVVLGGYAVVCWIGERGRWLGAILKGAGLIGVGIVVAGFIHRTTLRNMDYHDPYVLWRKVADLRGWQPRAQLQMGMAYLYKGMATQSIPYFEKVISMVPRHPVGYQYLAGAHAMLGSHTKSIDLYRQAVALGAKDARTQVNIASQHETQGRLELAVEHYRNAVRIEPNDPFYHLYLAVALYRVKEPDMARDHFERALTIRSWDPAFHFTYGIFLEATGQLHAAIGHYEQACALTNAPSVRYLNVLGKAYADAGRFTEAVDVTRRALAISQGNGKSHVMEDVRQRLSSYEAGKPYRVEHTGAKAPRAPHP